MNAPVQGTAADIIKLAMININQKAKDEMPDLKVILQIHDELLFEVPEDQSEAALKLVQKEMENVIELKVPLKVSTAVGNNWGEIH